MNLSSTANRDARLAVYCDSYVVQVAFILGESSERRQ